MEDHDKIAPRRRGYRWLLIGGLAFAFMLALGVGVLLGTSSGTTQASALTTVSNSSSQSPAFTQGGVNSSQSLTYSQGGAITLSRWPEGQEQAGHRGRASVSHLLCRA